MDVNQNQRRDTIVKISFGIFVLIVAMGFCTTSRTFAQDDENGISALDAARALGGDVIVMKTGRVMGGVQILRTTPLLYEVEIIEGLAPMKIPRRHVELVEFDDVDPLRDRRHDALRPPTDIELVADGILFDPEFETKLTAPVPGSPLDYKAKDYLNIFEELAKKCKVTIEIDKSLKTLIETDRQWTIKITPEMTLFDVLSMHWDKKFETGKITWKNDRVILSKKE